MSCHIMVDIETLGTRPGSVILSIGAVEFTLDGTYKEFYQTIDPFSSLLAGLTTDEDTCRWWSGQNESAIGLLLNDRRPAAGVLGNFSMFVRKDDFVWAKGPDFDLVMIQEAYRAIKRPIPWSYRNTRDVRTVLALGKAAGVKYVFPTVGEKHFALDDARRQAQQVIQVYKILGKELG